MIRSDENQGPVPSRTNLDLALFGGPQSLRSADAMKGKLLKSKAELPNSIPGHDSQATICILWKTRVLFHRQALSPHNESRLDAVSSANHSGDNLVRSTASAVLGTH
jgi:hypothetical protein